MYTESTHTNNSQRDEPAHTPPPSLVCNGYNAHLTMVIESGMETNKSMILLSNQNKTPKRNNNTRLSARELQNTTQNASPERSPKWQNHTKRDLQAISFKTQVRNARTAWEVFRKHPKRSRNANSKRNPKHRSICCVLKRRTQNGKRKNAVLEPLIYIYIIGV